MVWGRWFVCFVVLFLLVSSAAALVVDEQLEDRLDAGEEVSVIIVLEDELDTRDIVPREAGNWRSSINTKEIITDTK